MKKIIVTGATSMIGVAIIEEALCRDVERIYAVVRRNCTKLSRLPEDKRVKVIECDIHQYQNLPQMIHESCDVFYHIAWGATGAKRNENIPEQARNITYTLEALQVAYELGCVKFIGAGSQAEYGKLDIDKIAPDTPADPVQPYGIAKYVAGKLAMAEAAQLGISCIWARIFSVYGKYDLPTSMISTSLKKMLSGQPTAFTKGEQRWDYLYSDDAGRAFYLMGEKSTGNKVYCVGSGKARPLCEFIEEMRDAVDPSLEIGLGKIPYTEDTVMNLCADINSLSEDTGWKPQVTFSSGIKECVRYLCVGGVLPNCSLD